MSQPIRVGVIGAGGIARLRHLPAYQACSEAGTAEIVAVCDPLEENARRAAEEFHVPNVFADYHQVLALDGLDAVSICTPNSSHEPISLAALDRRVHVMCEKPLAMDYPGSRRMYETARRAERKTAVNFRYRWIPAAGFVRDLIGSGELGSIYHVYLNYFNGGLHDPTTPMRWRQQRSEAGSGALGDLASHLIDLARYWIGEIEDVTGNLRTFVTERPLVGGGIGAVDVDDAASFFARFRNGAQGSFNSSRCAVGRGNYQRAEIYGTKGAIVYEIEKGDAGGDHIQLYAESNPSAGYREVSVPEPYLANNPLRPMIDFVAAIRDNQEPTPNFYDGMVCQEVLDAVEISAREHRPVRLPLEGAPTERRPN